MSWRARLYRVEEDSKAVPLLRAGMFVYIVFAIGLFLSLACFARPALAGSSYRYNPPTPSYRNGPYERSEETAKKAFEQWRRNQMNPPIKNTPVPAPPSISPGEEASGIHKGD